MIAYRWYGESNDSVKLGYIRQIPGVEGIVWALHDLAAGEVWPVERIEAEKKKIEEAGFSSDYPG